MGSKQPLNNGGLIQLIVNFQNIGSLPEFSRRAGQKDSSILQCPQSMEASPKEKHSG